MPQQLLFLELNEINFDYVASYAGRGGLPNLGRLIRSNGVARTVSEQRYEELEPWIQWVTAHTGMPLAMHGVFRLGDIVHKDLPQIWEQLEGHGLSVGAISPMNAKNRLRRAAFFVPDPWTATPPTATPRLAALYQGIAQAVNENAQSKVSARSLAGLLSGFAVYARPANYKTYVQLAASSPRRPWRKALVLDLLLADVFIREVRRTSPDFASLFVNAGAHIQHHYLYSSACYEGPHRNPAWYLPAGADPVHEAYALYDRIVGQVFAAFPDARVMVATGLHQDPHDRVTYYWRLREHAAFLSRIRVECRRVEPRMSRDFLVVCESAEQAARAGARLSRAVAADGAPLFAVDNRGSELFVELVYSSEIAPGFVFSIDDETFTGLDRDVAFVALKNGRHNGIGYFLDSAATKDALPAREFPLAEVHERILDALVPAAPRLEERRAAARSA
jgi:Type I phosphodiesterase / nucleotide pyrophosphatase